MLGEPAYAEKMRRKVELAARHGVRLIELTPTDVRNLNLVFAGWANG